MTNNQDLHERVKEVELSEYEVAELLVMSFRYCLGRKTYVVSDCVEYLITYWECLPKNWQLLVHREIEDAIERGQAGMDMDIKEWEKILELNIKSN